MISPLRFGRALLVVAAVFAGAFGALCVARPDWVAGVSDIVLTSADARADFRALFGGGELGSALFYGFAATREAWVRPGLVALGAFNLAAAAMRIGSLIADRTLRGPHLGTALLEVSLVLLCAFALWRLERSGASPRSAEHGARGIAEHG